MTAHSPISVTPHEDLPVVVLGAGPVGLAAAAHLAQRQQPFLVLEAGPSIGHAIRQWGHVRLFSPWRYTVDSASRELLTAAGWQEPHPEDLPIGNDLVSRYLDPLAATSAIAPHLRLNSRAAAIGRLGVDRIRTFGREQAPFVIHLDDGTRLVARAVIDATGTWSQPNPMGADGIAPAGEVSHGDRIDYGLPTSWERAAIATPESTPSWSAVVTPPSTTCWRCSNWDDASLARA